MCQKKPDLHPVPPELDSTTILVDQAVQCGSSVKCTSTLYLEGMGDESLLDTLPFLI